MDTLPAEGRHLRPVWIYGWRTDLLIALCWVPLFVGGHLLAAGRGAPADSTLRWAVATTLLVSFLHQPLTLALVYGDRRQFRQRRSLFVWGPPATVALVAAAVTMHLWLVIPVAALWNTVHTLQQRYGLSRIYARKAGYGSARLDRSVLYAWMLAAALLVAANPTTPGLVRRVGLDGVNAGGVRLLSSARPLALALSMPVVLVSLALAAAIVRQEWRVAVEGLPGPAANPAKWCYQVSSLVLIASIPLDPAAGFIAYVGAHAIEYGIVVYRTTQARYGAVRDQSTLLGRLAWTAPGRLAVVSGVIGMALLARHRLHGDVGEVMLYTVGVLHFLYDGVIWKLRKPAVADSFAIGARSPAVR